MPKETIATRYASGTATAQDMADAQWQLERMDECEGGFPCTIEGAIALLASIEQESE